MAGRLLSWTKTASATILLTFLFTDQLRDLYEPGSLEPSEAALPRKAFIIRIWDRWGWGRR